MTTYIMFLKRMAIGFLVALQVLFYPSLSYAAAPTESGLEQSNSQSTSSAVSEADSQTTSESAPEALADTTSSDTAADEVEVVNPEAEPTNNSSTTPTADTSLDAETDATVTNDVVSNSQSGDAITSENYENGTAASGDSTAIANILNLYNSQANAIGPGNMYTFSADIYGDIYGDLFVDPATLNTIQNTDLTNTAISVVDTGRITNNVDLSATSGNAVADNNYENGTATSGSANAVANIVNIINSIISAGGSFFGNINIHGNLNGDILLPPNLLASVLATNSVPTTTITIDTSNTTDMALTNSSAIENQVTANANSGAATASGNLGNGSAQTGTGSTEVTVLNLTGRQIVGSNALLVFVNVQGEWIGVIMDAPAGSTAAMVGSNDINQAVSNNTNIDIDESKLIVNNINVTANSGNANASGNYENGTARSGDASASANIANMASSNLSLSGWFGVLFINVFGSWHGSFGIDTVAGGNSTAPQASVVPGQTTTPPAQVFQFVAASEAPNANPVQRNNLKSRATASNTITTQAPGAPQSQAQSHAGTTLSSSTVEPAATTLINDPEASDGGKSTTWSFTMMALGLAGLLLLAERIIAFAQRRRANVQ